MMEGRVEVFFLPTKFACVLFHFAPPGNSAAFVPFGFITKDPMLIEEAHRVIMDAAHDNCYLGPAEFKERSRKSGKAVFSEQFSFLNYCALSQRIPSRKL
jgi:hypothetical protein